MKKTLMASAAAVALIASTALAGAQGMDKGGAGPSGGAAAPPAASGGAAPGGAMNRNESPAARSGSEMRPDGGAAKQDATPDSRAQRDGAQPNARPQDNARDATQPDRKNQAQDNNAKQPDAAKTAGEKAGTDRDSSRTTGQAGAGAKISTEQRTQITTVIKQQKVQPVTKVNFNISVGTRVPRGGVTFHTLPAQVVTIYPEWRGYEYFLVRDEIIVVDPRTLEIVAVLPA